MPSIMSQMTHRVLPTSWHPHGWMATPRRARRKAGQALIEYAFLFVLLATVTIGVIVLAGNQVQNTYQHIANCVAHPDLGSPC